MYRFLPKYLAILTLCLGTYFNALSQSIDSLKLIEAEIPKGSTLSKESQCISIQACTFYDQPDIYEFLIGKLKHKEIQNFSGTNDSGSIMYFEFEKPFEAKGFVEGLLWGESKKPTKDHPEEMLVHNNLLIIWSLPIKSNLKNISQQKVKSKLK